MGWLQTMLFMQIVVLIESVKSSTLPNKEGADCGVPREALLQVRVPGAELELRGSRSKASQANQEGHPRTSALRSIGGRTPRYLLPHYLDPSGLRIDEVQQNQWKCSCDTLPRQYCTPPRIDPGMKDNLRHGMHVDESSFASPVSLLRRTVRGQYRSICLTKP